MGGGEEGWGEEEWIKVGEGGGVRGGEGR